MPQARCRNPSSPVNGRWNSADVTKAFARRIVALGLMASGIIIQQDPASSITHNET